MHSMNNRQTIAKSGWTSTLLGCLAAVVLAGAPALALARLGSDVLGSWQSSQTDAVAAPWSLDAPANTAHKFQVTQREVGRGIPVEAATEQENAILLTDWNYTLKSVVSSSN